LLSQAREAPVQQFVVQHGGRKAYVLLLTAIGSK
jgi:hypothetical protein